MSKTKMVLACVFLCSALLMTTAAQSSHNARNIPVTSTIYDPNPFTLAPSQIYSDASVYPQYGGVYPSSGTFLSVVGTDGCLHLGNNTTGTPTSRSFGIDLTLVNDFGQSTRVLPNGNLNGFGLVSFTTAQIIAGCDQSTGQNMLNMTTSSPIYTPLLVQFLSDGTLSGNYRLSIGDQSLSLLGSDHLTKAKITCISATTKCNEWTIESADSLGIPGPGNGTLWKIPATHPYKGWTYYGNYNFSFYINVHIQ